MRLIILVSLSLMFVGIQDANSQIMGSGFYKHRRRACNNHLAIKDYQYQNDKRVASASVMAVADTAIDANLNGADGVKEIRFHVPVSAVKTDRVSLENIGLAIFSNGHARCTGMLNHNGGGGINDGLRGSNVTIRIRAYAGVLQDNSVADAAIVWKSEMETWVYKNRPEAIAVADTKFPSAQLKLFFPKITHMEIEVEHQVDR